MDIKLGLVIAAALGAFGCATSGTGRGQPGFGGTDPEMPSVRVGELRVIDPHVNPMVPVHRSNPGTGVTRVVLDGNRFLLCWTEGTLESGHRAMAQMRRSSDGSPLGAPVEISPPDADVFGAPQVVTTNGHQVVATFAASSEGRFRLVAVPIDDVASMDPSELTARK